MVSRYSSSYDHMYLGYIMEKKYSVKDINFINIRDASLASERPQRIDGRSIVVGLNATDMENNTVVEDDLNYLTCDGRYAVNYPDGIVADVVAIYGPPTRDGLIINYDILRAYPWNRADFTLAFTGTNWKKNSDE